MSQRQSVLCRACSKNSRVQPAGTFRGLAEGQRKRWSCWHWPPAGQRRGVAVGRGEWGPSVWERAIKAFRTWGMSRTGCQQEGRHARSRPLHRARRFLPGRVGAIWLPGLSPSARGRGPGSQARAGSRGCSGRGGDHLWRPQNPGRLVSRLPTSGLWGPREDGPPAAEPRPQAVSGGGVARSAFIVSLCVSGAGRECACDLFLPRGFPASLGSPCEPGPRQTPWGPVWERPGLGRAGSLGSAGEPTGLCSPGVSQLCPGFLVRVSRVGGVGAGGCFVVSGASLGGPFSWDPTGPGWSVLALTCRPHLPRSLSVGPSLPLPTPSELKARPPALFPPPLTPPSPQGCGRPTRVSG